MNKRKVVVAALLLAAVLTGCGSASQPSSYVKQVGGLATALERNQMDGYLAVCIANVDAGWGQTSMTQLISDARGGNPQAAEDEYETLSVDEGIVC